MKAVVLGGRVASARTFGHVAASNASQMTPTIASNPIVRRSHRFRARRAVMRYSASSSWRSASLLRSSEAAPLKRMAPFSST